jgi:hypothetical protein
MSRHLKEIKTNYRHVFTRPNDRTPDILAAVEAEPPHDRLPGLWDYAAMVWDQMCGVFGSSLELIDAEYISKDSHRLLRDWLCNLEKLVRHIVFVAAIAMKLAPAKPAAGPWGPGRFQRTWWDDPLTWKVSFRMLALKRKARPKPVRAGQAAGADDDTPFRSPARLAKPLALRIEAVRRVLADHPAHVARFARQLARIKAGNAAANQPRKLFLPRWSFAPERRTSGIHAVARGMMIAQPLAENWLWKWEEPG